MKTSFNESLKNRTYMTPFVIGGLIVLLTFVVGVFNIRATELQVPVRYTSFGVTNFYTEQWFYQLVFMLFIAVVFAIHSFISLQLYKKKGVNFAVAFQWLTVVVLVLIFLTTLAIFRIADLS